LLILGETPFCWYSHKRRRSSLWTRRRNIFIKEKIEEEQINF